MQPTSTGTLTLGTFLINDNLSLNILPLDMALLNGNLAEILESSELFWLAFCKASAQTTVLDRFLFSVSINGNFINIDGVEEIISNLKNFIEEIRKLVLKGHLQKKSVTIVLPKLLCDDFNKYVVREKMMVDSLEHSRIDESQCLPDKWFESYVQPVLVNFFDFFNASCTEGDVIHQSSERCKDSVVEQGNTLALKIDWLCY